MEITAKSYWRRWRGYQRLDGSAAAAATTSRRRGKRIQIGWKHPDPTQKKKRFWKIKIVPKLKILKTASPKRVLVWLRDAYVKMMLRLANSRVIGPSGFGGDGLGFGRGPIVKEYDEKMLVEIYKSILMAQGSLVHRDAAKLGSDVVRRPVSYL